MNGAMIPRTYFVSLLDLIAFLLRFTSGPVMCLLDKQ